MLEHHRRVMRLGAYGLDIREYDILLKPEERLSQNSVEDASLERKLIHSRKKEIRAEFLKLFDRKGDFDRTTTHLFKRVNFLMNGAVMSGSFHHLKVAIYLNHVAKSALQRGTKKEVASPYDEKLQELALLFSQDKFNDRWQILARQYLVHFIRPYNSGGEELINRIVSAISSAEAISKYRSFKGVKRCLSSTELTTAYERYKLVVEIERVTCIGAACLNLGQLTTEHSPLTSLLEKDEKTRRDDEKWNRKVLKKLECADEKLLGKEFFKIQASVGGDYHRARRLCITRILLLMNASVVANNPHLVKVALHIDRIVRSAESKIRNSSLNQFFYEEELKEIAALFSPINSFNGNWKNHCLFFLNDFTFRSGSIRLMERINWAISERWEGLDQYGSYNRVLSSLASTSLLSAFSRYKLTGKLNSLMEVDMQLRTTNTVERVSIYSPKKLRNSNKDKRRYPEAFRAISDQVSIIKKLAWLSLDESLKSVKRVKPTPTLLQRDIISRSGLQSRKRLPRNLREDATEEFSCLRYVRADQPARESLKSSLASFVRSALDIRGHFKSGYRPKDFAECAKFYLEILEYKSVRVKVLAALKKDGKPSNYVKLKNMLKGTKEERDKAVKALNHYFDKQRDLFQISFKEREATFASLGRVDAAAHEFRILLEEGESLNELGQRNPEMALEDIKRRREKVSSVRQLIAYITRRVQSFAFASLMLCDYRWYKYAASLYEAALRYKPTESMSGGSPYLYSLWEGPTSNFSQKKILEIGKIFEAGIKRDWRKKCWIFIQLLKKDSSFKERIKLFLEDQKKTEVKDLQLRKLDRSKSLGSRDIGKRKLQERKRTDAAGHEAARWQEIKSYQTVGRMLLLLENPDIGLVLEKYKLVVALEEFINSYYFVARSLESFIRLKAPSVRRIPFARSPSGIHPQAFRPLQLQGKNIRELDWLDLIESEISSNRNTISKKVNRLKLCKLRSMEISASGQFKVKPKKAPKVNKKDEKGKDKLNYKSSRMENKSCRKAGSDSEEPEDIKPDSKEKESEEGAFNRVQKMRPDFEEKRLFYIHKFKEESFAKAVLKTFKRMNSDMTLSDIERMLYSVGRNGAAVTEAFIELLDGLMEAQLETYYQSSEQSDNMQSDSDAASDATAFVYSSPPITFVEMSSEYEDDEDEDSDPLSFAESTGDLEELPAENIELFLDLFESAGFIKSLTARLQEKGLFITIEEVKSCLERREGDSSGFISFKELVEIIKDVMMAGSGIDGLL